MSTLVTVSTRAVVSTQNRLALRGEHGQTSGEYGAVVLVAVALGLGLLDIVTHHALDGFLTGLMGKALTTATNMIK
jgi:hypothetical protein